MLSVLEAVTLSALLALKMFWLNKPIYSRNFHKWAPVSPTEKFFNKIVDWLMIFIFPFCVKLKKVVSPQKNPYEIGNLYTPTQKN